MGTLYLVATPIGNLEDVSARAIRILGEVRFIAAEDTRRTRTLLKRYDIHTQLITYHEHNKETKTPKILNALHEGDVALVSDAGTPSLNDPGFELVRAALEAGHQVSLVDVLMGREQLCDVLDRSREVSEYLLDKVGGWMELPGDQPG